MRNLEVRVAASQATGLNEIRAWCKDTDTGHIYAIAGSQIHRVLPDGPELLVE
jgi:hypothetical protein